VTSRRLSAISASAVSAMQQIREIAAQRTNQHHLRQRVRIPPALPEETVYSAKPPPVDCRRVCSADQNLENCEDGERRMGRRGCEEDETELGDNEEEGAAGEMGEPVLAASRSTTAAP